MARTSESSRTTIRALLCEVTAWRNLNAASLCTSERPVFVNRLRLMSAYPQRLLAITAALSTVKSSYPFSDVNPNRIMQSLIAALAGWNVPFVCTETHELGEEIVASYLYQVHLYHWLDSNGHGRYLADNDL